jgi:hypothetical protein
MKPIKRKFTPVRMLDVLTEIKILCKRNDFLPKNYCKKQPSIWHFTRVLIQKGVLKKEKDQYKWIGGEPNVEMAKGVIDSVNEYNQIKKVERESKVQNKENVVVEIPMTIAEQLTGIIGIDAEIEIQKKLKEEISQLKKENELFQGFIKNLINENTNLEIELENIKAKKSKSLNQKVEEIKTLPIEKPAPKKVKLFGITILKIE